MLNMLFPPPNAVSVQKNRRERGSPGAPSRTKLNEVLGQRDTRLTDRCVSPLPTAVRAQKHRPERGLPKAPSRMKLGE